MPTTENVLFDILIISTLVLVTIFAYLGVMAEAQWRFNEWISQLHACSVWKNDYLEYHQELEIHEKLLENPEDLQCIDDEDKECTLNEIYFSEWHATTAGEHYFVGLEHLDEVRGRLYSPPIFAMMIWQVFVPWGSVSMPKPSW